MDVKRLRPCSKAIKNKVSCVGNLVVKMENVKGGGVDERRAASVMCAMHVFRQKKALDVLWTCPEQKVSTVIARVLHRMRMMLADSYMGDLRYLHGVHFDCIIAGIHCHLRSCAHGVTLLCVFASMHQATRLSLVLPLLFFRPGMYRL